jgi:hypothetical protein
MTRYGYVLRRKECVRALQRAAMNDFGEGQLFYPRMGSLSIIELIEFLHPEHTLYTVCTRL